MKSWLITNKKEFLSENEKFSFYIDNKKQAIDEIAILINGHVLSREKSNFKIEQQSINKDVLTIYKAKGEDFINEVKGNFIIVIIERDKFYVFGDHFGIKKFFFWESEGSFIITNNLHNISNNVKLSPSPENMAMYALTYHFTAGRTLFEEVMHNITGQKLTFTNNVLTKDKYWYPECLLDVAKKDTEIKQIANELGNSIQSALNTVDKQKVSLSLTGGADTRNLLAIFLKKGIKPRLYTYGNPKSADCVKATKISKGLKLEHKIHDIEMNSDLFEKYAKKIISLSGGLASIHRVHRLIAVEEEALKASSMFLGTLGGEFVKGVSEDDYIVPPVVYDNWDKDNLISSHLKKYLKSKVVNKNLVDDVLKIINDEPYMKGDVNTRKFNSLAYITAHLHDAQDVNLYNSVMGQVFTPFLDLDYLNVLFSSQFTFIDKNIINNKILRKIENPVYCSKFIKETYKPLLKYPYSGDHKGSEVLFNKYYAAFAKIVRKKINGYYPPNFPLGTWMEDFVSKNLKLCKDNKVISDVFDIDKLIHDFSTELHQPKESYYLKYTNPIMMKFIIDEFVR